MGFKDFFQAVGEIGKGFGELTVGLAKVGVEGTAELGEILTDGVKEIAIKGNSDYKTSFEIKEESERIARSAKLRWYHAQDKAKKRIEETKNNILAIYTFKKDLYSQICDKYLDGSSSLIIHNDIEFQKLYGPDFSQFGFFVAANLGILGAGARKNMANEYLEDARYYSKQINEQISKLNTALILLDNIDYQITEERYLLNIIGEAIEKQVSLNYYEVAEILKEMMKKQIADGDGKIAEEYVQDYERLKLLCKSL